LADLPDDQLKPAPLLTGRDLIKRGYVPGPRFSEILTAVEDAQLEGSLASKEDALRFVHERFPQARS
jgi:poly(A) polymerase